MSVRTALHALSIALALTVPGDANAAPETLPEGAGAKVERIAAGVYAIIHQDATDEWPHGNTGVIVGTRGVLVVDSTYLPSRASGDIALIRALTPLPVRYLVNTHWHFDHNNGAIAYVDAYPDVQVVSERETRDFIVLNATHWAHRSIRPESTKRTSLAELERRLAGAGPGDKPLALSERRRLASVIEQRRNELAELGSLKVITPNVVFDEELSLDLGDRVVVLRDRGRANSPHDVTVYLPAENVIFVGDIIVQSPVPYVTESFPIPWISVLRELESHAYAAIVPGHGPVLKNDEYVRQLRKLFEDVSARMAQLARKGFTLDEARAQLDPEEFRKDVPVWQGESLREDWKLTIELLAERAWRGVRGQGS